MSKSPVGGRPRRRDAKPLVRSTIRPDYIFDIECQNWDTFVVGAVHEIATGSTTVYSWHRQRALVDHLLSLEGNVYAHNGGGYDVLWLLDRLLDKNVRAELTVTGQRILCMRVNDVEFRDSFAVLPMGLKAAAEIGGCPKVETGLECVCGEACGGYCSISRAMPGPAFRRLCDYLVRDCKALAAALDRWIAFAAENDLDICDTIGQSAWSYLKRTLGLESARWKDTEHYTFARGAYFGGRTQAGRTRAESGYSADLNSAYPASLTTTPLPHGPYRHLTGRMASDAYRKGSEGVFAMAGRVSERRVPPLPYRMPDRIAYPIGPVDGTYTGLELRHAEAHGLTIDHISRALVWDATAPAPLLRDGLLAIWRLRYSVGKSTALGKLLKLYANAPTGKLAQRPERQQIVLDRNIAKPCPGDHKCFGLHTPAQPCCRHQCTGKCGRYLPIDTKERLWVRNTWSLSGCAHVQWAAYLTANTRAVLYSRISRDDSVYWDTDCCKSLTFIPDGIGDDLGMWGDEGPFYDFACLSPKAYSYIDARTGEFVARLKGIPDAPSNWERALSTDGVDINRGVFAIKSAARQAEESGRMFVRKAMTRHAYQRQRWIGDRVILSDGDTRPATIAELKERDE